MDLKWRTHDLTLEDDGLRQDRINDEWLVTNGTGAYAMGTVGGCNTRRYHGLLVASTRPPVGRVVAVNQMLEHLEWEHDGQRQRLEWTSCAFRDAQGGVVRSPQGHRMVRRFEKGLSVRWTCRSGPAEDLPGNTSIELIRELYLHWGQQAATLRYEVRVLGGHEPVALPGGVLCLSPMVTLRDYHALLRMPRAGAVSVQPKGNGVATVCRGDVAVTLSCPGAVFRGAQPMTDPWWHDIYYPLETERGQDDHEDYFIPGRFEVRLDSLKEGAVTLTAALGADPADPGAWSRKNRQKHLKPILSHLGQAESDMTDDRLRACLAIASDDFVVDRRFQGRALKTILAGYPWFADWGRDTFISLPGLLLATGRFSQAKSTLRVFAAAVRDGLVPNRFDDYDETAGHYNAVDASLWFVHASIEYVSASGDRQSWDQWLADAAIQVLEAYIHGTKHDIRMAGDGLIMAGSPKTQLTWMDAACDGVVFTPRHGKAVEINALWYNALVGVAELVQETHRSTADHYNKLAKRVKRSFSKVFWDQQGGYLIDHAWVDQDGVDQADRTLRPNQIFAVSLPRSPLPRTKQRQVVTVVRDHLLTPYGLRTLPRTDEHYHGRYTGPAFDRDEAYHQGTVWPWLIGPYAESLLRLGRFSDASKAQAREAIGPLLDELLGRGLGQLHEIYEGDPPHRPVGCMAQAWSVAEVLRVWCLLAR